MQWNERQDTASEIMGLADARERERHAFRPEPGQSRRWPRRGSLGRWIGYGLLAVVLAGWLITALTRAS